MTTFDSPGAPIRDRESRGARRRRRSTDVAAGPVLLPSASDPTDTTGTVAS
jgi:hypothetical protein